VYGNRRRIRGDRGKGLLRRRGELLERSFAHAYETGGMRRLHLCGGDNVLKRVLIHVGGLNLSLVMRQLPGKGTPRGLQGLSAESLLMLWRLWIGFWFAQNRRAHHPMLCPALHAQRIFIPVAAE
jgi:hypothetical protein